MTTQTQRRAIDLRTITASDQEQRELEMYARRAASPIAKADTRHVNASHDYAVLKQEAWRLIDRIMGEFLDDSEPEGVNWGHVGDMARTRDALREINDQLFLEGEYSEARNA